MNKIIFLTVEKLTKFNYNRFGIDLINSRGLKVEVWDTSPILRPKYYKSYKSGDSFQFNEYKIIESKEQLIQAIGKLTSKDIVCWAMVLTNKRFFIYEHLKNITFGFLFIGALPQVTYTIKEKILSKQNILHKILWDKLSAMVKTNKHIHAPKFIITGGSKSVDGYRNVPINNKRQNIKSHSMDYDRFLDIEFSPYSNGNKEPFTVYIDQNIPFHPDNIFGELDYGTQDCTLDKYLPEINQFFDWFEDKYKTEIIIAVHPSANYKESVNLFNGRRMVCGNTANYIKHAENVLIHNSTAVNFAVLYKKPLIFLKSDNYSFALNSMTQTFANEFGQEPINISKDYPYKIDFTIKHNLYDNYKNSYIKEKGTPEKKLWDIVLDNFEELNDV